MALSWNEIRENALRFSKEWKEAKDEDADEKRGSIDLLWKGVVLIEHKSRGKSLDKAYKQAIDYFPRLADYELPK